MSLSTVSSLYNVTQMKHHASVVLLFLILGAIVNIGVAWYCALGISFANQTDADRGARFGPEVDLAVDRYDRLGAIHIEWYRSSEGKDHWEEGPDPLGLIPAWGRLSVAPAGEALRELGDIEGRGWPMLSMWWEQDRISWTSDSNRRHEAVLGALETALPPFSGDMGMFPRVLPIRPIWTGLLVNSVFYTCVLWLLLRVWIACRRIVRLTRGHCPNCCYPRGQSPVCTECGEPPRIW